MLRNKFRYLHRELPYKYNFLKVPPPQTIYLVINSRCNLNCKMCDVGTKHKESHFYQNMVSEEGDLPTYVIEKFIEEVAPFNPLIAIISTEPLLHPNIINIIKMIRKNRLKCQLTTNGFKLPDFAKELVDIDLDVLYVSLDGNKDTHNYIRGNERAWDNAIHGMAAVNAFKRESKKKYPRVRVNYTISGYNYDKMVDFIESRYHFEDDEYPTEISNFFGHVCFSHLNMVTEEMASVQNLLHPNMPCNISSVYDEKLLDIDIDILWDQIQTVKKNYSRAFFDFVPDLQTKTELETYYNEPYMYMANHTKCKVPWHAAQIFADGSVGVSTRCYTDARFGNIKTEKFLDIWNGKKFNAFRKELKDIGAYPACARCCGVF